MPTQKTQEDNASCSESASDQGEEDDSRSTNELSDEDDSDEEEVDITKDAEAGEHLFIEINSSIDLLANRFGNPLLNANVQIPTLKMEYKSLSDYLRENYKLENLNYIEIWRNALSFGSCWSH